MTLIDWLPAWSALVQIFSKKFKSQTRLTTTTFLTVFFTQIIYIHNNHHIGVDRNTCYLSWRQFNVTRRGKKMWYLQTLNNSLGIRGLWIVESLWPAGQIYGTTLRIQFEFYTKPLAIQEKIYCGNIERLFWILAGAILPICFDCCRDRIPVAGRENKD